MHVWKKEAIVAILYLNIKKVSWQQDLLNLIVLGPIIFYSKLNQINPKSHNKYEDFECLISHGII